MRIERRTTSKGQSLIAFYSSLVAHYSILRESPSQASASFHNDRARETFIWLFASARAPTSGSTTVSVARYARAQWTLLKFLVYLERIIYEKHGDKTGKRSNRNPAVACLGEGQPTVVLESGFGDDAGVWASPELQPKIATFSKVCAYSRAGLGESDPAPGQRTVQGVVDDLAALLADSSMDSPFVLVGHSIGGLLINMYAHQRPQQVAGLVFVDSSHPNQGGKFRKALPTALNDAFDLHGTPPENWDLLGARKQGETDDMRSGSLGNKPVVVLTADTTLVDRAATDWTKENIWADYNEDVDRAEKTVWKGLQEQYAGLSNNTRHTEVRGSSHYIQHHNPEVVAEAIRQVVEAVRTGEPLV